MGLMAGLRGFASNGLIVHLGLDDHSEGSWITQPTSIMVCEWVVNLSLGVALQFCRKIILRVCIFLVFLTKCNF